jgi:hypothetical protein
VRLDAQLHKAKFLDVIRRWKVNARVRPRAFFRHTFGESQVNTVQQATIAQHADQQAAQEQRAVEAAAQSLKEAELLLVGGGTAGVVFL